MSKIYMITVPRVQVPKRAWKIIIENHDIHKWIIAKETGKGGLEHWQVRIATNQTFDELKSLLPTAHIEESTQWTDYEKKEGKYVSSDDNNSILQCRYGQFRPNQKRIVESIRRQSDRNITVVCDPIRGNHGKSWLIRKLFETGKGYYVPPTIGTVQGIIQYVASGYRGQGIIIIDIPRSSKWSTQLYEAIETIKDGLVYDTRYHAQMRNIGSPKLLIMTNSVPVLDNLSLDRWQILNTDGIDVTAIAHKNAWRFKTKKRKTST